ncbi:MAG: DUF4337 domain-containing protein [Magnetococcales bacterium]|nr:DUF4337 domain-containing protein [Magnetococcales bacterium]
MEIREAQEMVEEAGEGGHHGHGHGEGGNGKRIAILISVLACMLAVIEMGGKSAQHNSMSANIEASNLWAFFQAKTIRMSLMRAGSDFMLNIPQDLPADKAAGWKKMADTWKAEAARFDSEPETREGRKELMARAKEAEKRRDVTLAAYHLFEYAAAALQISIVLAAASVTTGVMALAFGAGGLGLVGVVIGMIGWFAPTAIHF